MFVHILLALELFLHSLFHDPTYDLFILFLPLTKYGDLGGGRGEGSKREEQKKSNQDDN